MGTNLDKYKSLDSFATKSVVDNNRTIIEKFPQYHFKPTNLMVWKKPRIMMILFVVNIIIMLLGIVMFIGLYTGMIDKGQHHTEENYIAPVVFFLWGLIWSLITKRPWINKRTKPLNEIADYIQKYHYLGIIDRKSHPRYVFFIKDGKFGLMNVTTYSVAIPAEYDSLSWHKEKGYIKAIKDNNETIIDINGNKMK